MSACGVASRSWVYENGLSAGALAALAEIVSGVRVEDRCYFAVWEGYGWLHGGGA